MSTQKLEPVLLPANSFSFKGLINNRPLNLFLQFYLDGPLGVGVALVKEEDGGIIEFGDRFDLNALPVPILDFSAVLQHKEKDIPVYIAAVMQRSAIPVTRVEFSCQEGEREQIVNVTLTIGNWVSRVSYSLSSMDAIFGTGVIVLA